MSGIIAFLIKLGFGGVVDKALDQMERRAEMQNDSERLKSETTVALAREAVGEAKIMADYNRAQAVIFLVLGVCWHVYLAAGVVVDGGHSGQRVHVQLVSGRSADAADAGMGRRYDPLVVLCGIGSRRFANASLIFYASSFMGGELWTVYWVN